MKNVIIFGAYINNKGAQSMIFTVVDKVKKRFPESNISLVVDKIVSPEIRGQYNFDFIYVPMKDKLKLSGNEFYLVSLLIKGKEDIQNFNLLKKRVEKADILIDISGFSLSSKFSRNNTINYLSQISLAKKFNKPIYLLPQSFGPFDYNVFEKPIIISLIKKYLKYPKLVFARENDGFQLLQEFKLNNVIKSLDTVFYRNDEYNLENIFNVIPDTALPIIKKNSVGIIPNVKTINEKNIDEIYLLYKNTIKKLLDKGKYVYLLRHSKEDLEIISSLYKDYANHKKVFLIDEEYNSIDLQQIIKKFDYIIASRYHSIVHAYKVGTPAIVLGWAVKYKELLNNFGQNNYQFDVNNIDSDLFINKVEEMNANYLNEKEIITIRKNGLIGENIFDSIIK